MERTEARREGSAEARSPPMGEERIDLGSCSGVPDHDPEQPRELPRKEVIQPHLPVRLPCYDFVPIAGSALDTSPPCGSGQWLQAFPTFMT